MQSLPDPSVTIYLLDPAPEIDPVCPITRLLPDSVTLPRSSCTEPVTASELKRVKPPALFTVRLASVSAGLFAGVEVSGGMVILLPLTGTAQVSSQFPAVFQSVFFAPVQTRFVDTGMDTVTTTLSAFMHPFASVTVTVYVVVVEGLAVGDAMVVELKPFAGSQEYV